MYHIHCEKARPGSHRTSGRVPPTQERHLRRGGSETRPFVAQHVLEQIHPDARGWKPHATRTQNVLKHVRRAGFSQFAAVARDFSPAQNPLICLEGNPKTITARQLATPRAPSPAPRLRKHLRRSGSETRPFVAQHVLERIHPDAWGWKPHATRTQNVLKHVRRAGFTRCAPVGPANTPQNRLRRSTRGGHARPYRDSDPSAARKRP
jgi:hypothetical protein